VDRLDPIMIPFETGVGYGYAPNPQVNSRLQHHTSGSYTQPNMIKSNASTTPMPTTIQEVIDRFNANLAKQMKDDYGIEVKNKNISYQEPYPSSFDSVPYPIGWCCPEFVKFNGDDSKTTWEHVRQYLAQLGEASAIEEIRVCLFSLSLIGNAFSWFVSLPVNSIRTWEQLEQKFHVHFYSGVNELRLSHLISVRQKHDEPITSYIRRFRETKNRCYNLVISERGLAELAFNGLRSHIREKLEGHEFIDVAQVLVRALAHESRSKETRLKSDRPNMHMLDYASSDDESKEVCVAEFTWLPNDKANTCASLKPAHKSRDEMIFTFDVAKCNKIFDELFKSGKIKMSHTIPHIDQLKRCACCKFHNSFSHANKDCNTFCR
jgi:hypothetical protein